MIQPDEEVVRRFWSLGALPEPPTVRLELGDVIVITNWKQMPQHMNSLSPTAAAVAHRVLPDAPHNLSIATDPKEGGFGVYNVYGTEVEHDFVNDTPWLIPLSEVARESGRLDLVAAYWGSRQSVLEGRYPARTQNWAGEYTDL